MLCLSYYCLYFLFNKIRDKGRTKLEIREVTGLGGRGKGWAVVGRNDPNNAYTYE
jgi:hypothetical protein